jgi:F-type H+-transporting ATPase subunit epsilon
MKITLYTIDSNRSFEADSLLLPGAYAPFEVLKGYVPIISTLEAGIIRWRERGKEESLKITGGVVRVVKDNVEICAEL